MLRADEQRRAYWRANLTYLVVLLATWCFVSYGCGVLFADALDRVKVAGFKLGFWFAQQGSIYTFVALIFVYVALMNRLDRRYDVDEEAGAPLERGDRAAPHEVSVTAPPEEREP